jgi:type I restriction enzyme, S subunit
MANLNQLSTLPDNWKTLPFLEAVKDVTGGNSKIKQSDAKTIGVYPVIDQGQQENCGFIDNKDDLCQEELPTILFGDHTKIIKFIDYPFALGADGVKVLSPKAPIDKKFLFYFLKTLKLPENAGYSRHFKFLKEAVVPIPPLPEQNRIAAILDKADSLRRKNQQAIQLADQFLRAVFLDMFGDPVTNPKVWNIRSLGEACQKITDGTHHSPPIMETGVPYITAKHLKKTGLEFYKDPWYISPESHKAIYARCKPEKYDVLYIKDGATTGLAAINEYDFKFSMLSSLALLKPNREIMLPEFLTMFLNHPRSKSMIIANMSGAAITRLTLAKIKDIRLPIPPIAIQQKFGSM